LRERLNKLADFTPVAESGLEIKVVKTFLLSCPYFSAILENEW